LFTTTHTYAPTSMTTEFTAQCQHSHGQTVCKTRICTCRVARALLGSWTHERDCWRRVCHGATWYSSCKTQRDIALRSSPTVILFSCFAYLLPAVLPTFHERQSFINFHERHQKSICFLFMALWFCGLKRYTQSIQRCRRTRALAAASCRRGVVAIITVLQSHQ
jgi:hypothetical protein